MVADAVVILAGFVAVAGIAWFFWGPRPRGYRATPTTSGYQEATILVKGGYSPDTVVVKAGSPVRLTFRREEASPCSEMVVFGDFDRSARLPEGQQVPVEFTPAAPGTFEFTCQMGMLRGRLVVELS
jgi:plastocyanin domain-containing protein